MKVELKSNNWNITSTKGELYLIRIYGAIANIGILITEEKWEMKDEDFTIPNYNHQRLFGGLKAGHYMLLYNDDSVKVTQTSEIFTLYDFYIFNYITHIQLEFNPTL